MKTYLFINKKIFFLHQSDVAKNDLLQNLRKTIQIEMLSVVLHGL
jgi:hypothetical protein